MSIYTLKTKASMIAREQIVKEETLKEAFRYKTFKYLGYLVDIAEALNSPRLVALVISAILTWWSAVTLINYLR